MYIPARHYEPNGRNTATHFCPSSETYYREPGSGAAVKWLVWREGEMMHGWVGGEPKNIATLERLQ